jgi:hypothetical protein
MSGTFLNRRVGGPQSWSGRSEAEKSLVPLPGVEPQIMQPID